MFSAIKSIVIVKVSQETLQWSHMPPQYVFFWMACILEAKQAWRDTTARVTACVPSCCFNSFHPAIDATLLLPLLPA